ncbi:MAG: arginase [Bradymonadia bacterium]
MNATFKRPRPRDAGDGLELIIAPSDLGAGTRGAAMGPEALMHSALAEGLSFFERAPQCRVPMPTLRRRHLVTASIDYLDDVVRGGELLCARHRDLLAQDSTTLCLSGCHANAVGWVAGAREAFPEARIGLIWLDAHGDLHSPWTSPTGNVHGMPLAALLDADNLALGKSEVSDHTQRAWSRLKRLGPSRICPKLQPEDVLLVDIRDLEDEEWGLIHSAGIPHVTAAERSRIGVDGVLRRARAQFADYDLLLVTFDVDCLDAPLVPGTGTPVKGGMSEAEALTLLEGLVALPAFRSLDICEINPLLDRENSVARRMARMLRQLWPGLARTAVPQAAGSV